jgi:hypothetical protein
MCTSAIGTLCARATLSARGATGVPHIAGCANDKVVNAKLLKLKKSFFMAIASREWFYRLAIA